MLIDYDKTFPESARTPRAGRRRDRRLPVGLADQRHQPRAADRARTGSRGCSTSTTAPGPRRTRSSWCRRTRPARSAACGSSARPRSSGPAGDILARTWARPGWPWPSWTSPAEIATARRVLRHLDERRPETYRCGREDRPADLLDEAARRRRAHPRAGRGAGRRRARGDGVDAGPRRRRRASSAPSTRACGSGLCPFADVEGEGGRAADPAVDRGAARRRSTADAYDVVHAQDCISANAVSTGLEASGRCTTSTSSRRPSWPPATSGRSSRPSAHVCVSAAVAAEVARRAGARPRR